jgi:hypothetical protein
VCEHPGKDEKKNKKQKKKKKKKKKNEKNKNKNKKNKNKIKKNGKNKKKKDKKTFNQISKSDHTEHPDLIFEFDCALVAVEHFLDRVHASFPRKGMNVAVAHNTLKFRDNKTNRVISSAFTVQCAHARSSSWRSSRSLPSSSMLDTRAALFPTFSLLPMPRFAQWMMSLNRARLGVGFFLAY